MRAPQSHARNSHLVKQLLEDSKPSKSHQKSLEFITAHEHLGDVLDFLIGSVRSIDFSHETLVLLQLFTLMEDQILSYCMRYNLLSSLSWVYCCLLFVLLDHPGVFGFKIGMHIFL